MVLRGSGGTGEKGEREMKEVIDRKFIFKAVNPCNGKEYTEENALILLAKDRAVVPALEAYAKSCAEIGANPEHIGSIGLLIDRVREYQGTVEMKTPDTIGECEIARCIDGDV